MKLRPVLDTGFGEPFSEPRRCVVLWSVSFLVALSMSAMHGTHFLFVLFKETEKLFTYRAVSQFFPAM